MYDTYFDRIWNCGSTELKSLMDEIWNDDRLTEDEKEDLLEQANCAYEP